MWCYNVEMPADSKTWMIYGANGYTGRLAAKEAVRRGSSPVLAGRNGDEVASLAGELGLEHRVFGLDDPRSVRQALDGLKAVLHCAGPFSATSAPMVDACLATGTHYLDITGEISVFEAVHARHEEARRRDVVLLPGAGFAFVAGSHRRCASRTAARPGSSASNTGRMERK